MDKMHATEQLGSYYIYKFKRKFNSQKRTCDVDADGEIGQEKRSVSK